VSRAVVAGAVVLVVAGAGFAWNSLGAKRPVETFGACDGGDEAFARQVIPFLFGRLPDGVREVRVVADLVSKLGRAETVKLLARGPECESRWSDWLLDETQVNRAGHKEHKSCFDAPLAKDDPGTLATRLREADPREIAADSDAFNMADVLRSTLRLDDLTPFYRARLFSLLARPIWFCRNIPELDNEIGRRRNVGDLFSKMYLHRNVDCLACHNSEFSVTQRKDPEKNRFFAVPGKFETLLFGHRRGRDVGEMFQAFRYYDVVTSPDPTAPPKWRRPAPTDPARLLRPWGLHESCGTFSAKDKVPDDPANFEGFLGASLGRTGTIWDVEKLLHEGVDKLTARGSIPDSETSDLTAAEALASMLAIRVAHQVWMEAFGTPLTVAHFFPRTETQEKTLKSLADTLVASRWSLRSLLVAIATHPEFNPAPPNAACAKPYAKPVLFNAWSYEESIVEKRGNDVGDTVHRADARELVKAVSRALEWPEPPRFPSNFEEQVFLERAGAFVSDGNAGSEGVSFQGLLAWESRFGACELPMSDVRVDPIDDSADTRSCKSRCGRGGEGDRNAEACWCDAACAMHGDCCADFEGICRLSELKRPADWIDRAMSTVAATPGATVRDAVLQLKDRLVSEPVLEKDEEPLVASVFEVASLDVPASEVSSLVSGARAFCGVLVKSPAFLLRRVPSPAADPPTIVLTGASYADTCARFSDRAATLGWQLTCASSSLSLRRPLW